MSDDQTEKKKEETSKTGSPMDRQEESDSKEETPERGYCSGLYGDIILT